MSDATPMLQQYQRIKAMHPDAILMFRLGDFYEMFNEDAEVASRVLDIVLTSRETGKGRRMPMCGVPYHAASGYISRLVDAGLKVAVCDQMELPGRGRGVVRREVTRVVTPGTVTEPEFLDAKANNYLAAVVARDRALGLAVADVSTGEFLVTQAFGLRAEQAIIGELARFAPRECLMPAESGAASVDARLARIKRELDGIAIARREDLGASASVALKAAREHFGEIALERAGCDEFPAGVHAAGLILLYLRRTQMTSLSYMGQIRAYSCSESMALDPDTRRSLELADPIRHRSRGPTLLQVLDRTITPMGARLLRRWMEGPSLDLGEINRRLDAVEALVRDPLAREEVVRALGSVRDVERLCARAATGSANARDLVALAESFSAIPEVQRVLREAECEPLEELATRMGDLSDVRDAIRAAISDDPPPVITEGGLIREGYDAVLDEIRRTGSRSRESLASLEAAAKERTGIKSLKIGYNQVFGYYIEVTKPNLHLVPEDWKRKQTLSSAERFVTPELEQHERVILTARDRAAKLEYELFCAVRERVARDASRIQEAARALAEVDVFVGLARAAAAGGYVRPEVHEGDEIELVGVRHPVVETVLPAGGYVPNDVRLDANDTQIMVLTGPNMAGKSTLGKSVLLAVLMAHMGSFVPARSARIPLTDRIAVRAGSSEEISSGKSTFMAELLQTAAILSLATSRSLIFVDELGRGTSTYDGMAIAQAVIEHIHDRLGAKTIFTTHFHELTELEDRLARVRNYRVAARERAGEVVFLFALERGGCDKSYGINVARMAGMPQEIVRRAGAILRELERRSPSRPQQMTLLAALMDDPDDGGRDSPATRSERASEHASERTSERAEIIDELRGLDIDSMTPVQALTKLAEFKSRLERDETE